MAAHGDLRAAEAQYRSKALATDKKMANGPWLWFAVAVLLFILDRFLKEIAIARGADPAPGIAAFSLFRNTGIAFSLPLPPAVFWPAAAVIFAVLLGFFARSLTRDLMRAGMLALIILGAASNLIDRFLYASIIDYLLFFGRSAVNVADGMIVAGLVALYAFGTKKDLASTHSVQQ
mgnify:CR=1 FL=1